MTLQSSISRIRRLHRLGRWLAAILLSAAIAALLALSAGLLDAWLAFEASPRTTLVTAALIVLALAALTCVFIASRFPVSSAASAADHLLASPRRPASAALSLPRKDKTPLSEFLAARANDSAAQEIAALPASRVIPWRTVRLSTLALFLATLPIAILALASPDATRTVAARLLHPSADLPPWSKLRFAITPAKPAAIYGGELQLAVEITGDTPAAPVELLIRRPNDNSIQRLPTFRESGSRFSRTLDSLTEPVSVAFACGKARSRWTPVELLLQPKVLAGKTTVTPPAYTTLPPISSPLDSNEIAALEGSEVSLSLTSNRPLAPSTLTFTPATPPGITPVPEQINGDISSPDTVTFRWTATLPGTLSVLLRDVRGTPAAAPLELTLKAIPDQPPLVDITSPPRFLLATPSSILPITGRAEDDFSLAKIRLVRTLEGFRDRSSTVASSLQEKAFDFGDSLPLAGLGVSPGQVIELFLEASDHNPSLLGQGSSEISRIQIITEEDYAQRIRAKTTLEQFNARYRAINDAINDAKKSLENMKEAAKNGDPEASRKAAEAAKKAHEQAAELLDRLANDFPAFEMEKRLAEIAKNAASDIRKNSQQLGNLKPSAPPAEQEKEIDEMLKRLGAREKEQQQLQQDAALMAEAGKLMEMAAKFQQIYQTQQSLSNRILAIAKQIHEGNDENRRLLASLADTQEKNRQALDEFAKELEARAAAIQNPELAPMVDSARDFLQALRTADPQSVMEQSEKSGRLGAAEDAYVQAEMSRALLENLMQKQAPFPSACKGQCQGMKFSVPFPDVNQTMQQLLEGLMCQNPGYNPGQGQGGGGMGSAGTGPTGNAAPGFGMSDVPVLGPQRMMFEPPSLGGSTDGKGATARPNPLANASENETLKPSETPRETRHAPDPESVPEPYRDAVKKYFTP